MAPLASSHAVAPPGAPGPPIRPPAAGIGMAAAGSSVAEPEVTLPLLPASAQVVEDYRRLQLSLKDHPLAFLRTRLARRGIIPAAALAGLPSGRRVRVAGLVLVRQRPGTASGVIFMTLEDEGAWANVIVWPRVFERFRPQVLGARLVAVAGRLQNAQDVVHVIADRVDDLSPLLAGLDEGGAGDPAAAGTTRPEDPGRPPPDGSGAPATQLQPGPDSVFAAMPKGRNFQ